ncbi:MAG: hypothetical protein L0Z62_50855 [Gemmataceae bacterium]|nr:hypothetical protein [Gemmataceae bacterium]
MRHKLYSPWRCAGLVALLAAVAVSCNGAKNKIIPVTGKLLFADGKPLPAGTRLIFNPGEGGAGSASGVTSADGSFTVTHVTGKTGAEVGKYAVLLAAPEGGRESFFKIVPKEYYDGGVFFAEVKEGMPPLELKVKKAQPR